MSGRFLGALFGLCLSSAAAAAVAPSLTGAHLRLLKVDTELASDGTAVVTKHVEAGADNAGAAMALGQTSVPYITANQTLEIVEAYTRKADGTKIPVDVSAIYDQLPPAQPGAPMITDVHVKTIVFPQFAVGDTAVYTARLVTKHAIFPGQYWGGEAFPKQIAFDDVEETLTAPSDLALHMENHSVAFEKNRKNGQTVYHWHYSAPASTEAQSVTAFPLAHVPHYFVSTFPDYAALGRAYAEAAAPASTVTPTVKALADRITKGASDRRAVARALYEWVAGHIRYVAIELGKGSLIPHPVDTVLSNGYGDCKDHVALLAALLQAEGIASEAVLINALSDYELPDVATFAELDHVITYIPDLDLYLDSTGGVAPFGSLAFTEYGKPVVFASATAPRLGKLPMVPQGLARTNLTTVSHLDKNGVLSGKTTIAASGPWSIQLRAMALGIQAIGPEEAARRLLKVYGMNGNPTGSFEMSSPTELADSYTINSTFRIDDWSNELNGSERFYLPGGMRLLGVSGDGLMGSFLENSAVKADEEIPCYNGEASEDLSLEAPAGVQFSGVPSDTHVETANIRFDAHWSLAGQTLSVHRSFKSTIDRSLCTTAIRAANADALKKIADSYNTELSFQSSSSPATNQSYERPNEGDSGSFDANVDLNAGARDTFLNTELAEARDAMKRHEDDAAISRFSDILARPDVPGSAAIPARYDRAVLYARNGRYEESITDLNAALVLSPDDALTLFARARVHFLRADFAKALADCSAELAQYPSDATALRLRANIEMEMGKYPEAVRDYTAELQVTADPNALVLRAVASRRLGHESDAAADVAQALNQGDTRAETDYDAILGGASSADSAARAKASSYVVADAAQGADDPGVAVATASNDHASFYPPLSALLGETGKARVGFEIASDGSVNSPVIEKSSGFPALDAAALESVKSWRYNPARRNGQPVASHYSANVVWSEKTGS